MGPRRPGQVSRWGGVLDPSRRAFRARGARRSAPPLPAAEAGAVRVEGILGERGREWESARSHSGYTGARQDASCVAAVLLGTGILVIGIQTYLS